MITSHYTTGPNSYVTSTILGNYWRVAFQDQALIGAVCRAQGLSLDDTEYLERALLSWLDETQATQLVRATRTATILSTDIVRRTATIGTGLTIGGSGVVVGQPSASTAWIVPLPFRLLSCPYVGTAPDRPVLTDKVDYQLVDGNRLIVNRDPSTCGFTEMLVDDDDTPVLALQMVFPACIPADYPEGYRTRYGVWNATETAGTAAFDLLVGEASLSRILHAAMTAVGIVPPTVFEETDDSGAFTWGRCMFTEGANTLIPTSGGEMLFVPTALGPTMPTTEWKIRPGISLCSAIALADSVESSPLAAYCLDTALGRGVLVPNSSVAVGTDVANALPGGISGGAFVGYNLQIRGFFDEIDAFYAKLTAGLAVYGKTIADLVTESPCNPVSVIFSATGGSSPPVLTVNAAALAAAGSNAGVFQAIRDTLPAGSRLITHFSASIADTATLTVAETLTPFIVCESAETISIACSEHLLSRSHL